MSGVDPAFGIDDLQTAKVLNETETVKTNILTLLFMRPGTHPSLPTLGIAIQDYMYQFFDSLDPNLLKNTIAAQCEEWIPQVQNGTLDVVKTIYNDQPTLLIKIPTVIDDQLTALVVGISQNTVGEITYNSVIDSSLL